MVPTVSKEHTASIHTAAGPSEPTVNVSEIEQQFQQQITGYICNVRIYAAGCRLPHNTLQQHLAQMRSIFQIRFQNQSWLAVTQHKNIRYNHAHSLPDPGRFIATALNIPLPQTASLFTPRSLYSKTTNAEKNSKEWWERHKWKNRVGFAIRSFLFKTLQPTLLCPAVHRSLGMSSRTLKMI